MAKHPLLQKRGLDAVNEQLLQETDYPAADKDYVSPFAAKGTEYDPTKIGTVRIAAEPSRLSEFRRTLDSVEKNLQRAERLCPDNLAKQMVWSMLEQVRRFQMQGLRVAAKNGKVDYIKLAQAVSQALDLLSRVAPKGSELADAAESYVDGLNDAIRAARRQAGRVATGKRAEIEMHEDPKFLPPRNDMRSHLDNDVKKEMDEDREAGV